MKRFKCTKCGQNLPESAFHSNGSGQRRSACRECERARRRDKYVKHKVLSKTPLPSTKDVLEDHRRQTEVIRLREQNKRLIKDLHDAHQRIKVVDDIKLKKSFEVKRRESQSGLREATAVALCSDWHVEETVEAEKVNGMNEYSLEIADKRIDKLLEGFLWHLEMYREKFAIRDMVLWLGGDLMTGYIHEELEESNQLSPVETILWLQQRLVKVIDTLLEEGELEKLIIPCSFGNHGRCQKKKRISTGAENSFEWLMYQQLKQWYKDDERVQISAPKSQLIYLDVYDFTLRFAHGDQLQYMGGVGGVFIPLHKKIANWDIGRRADVTCIGHFHQYLSLPSAVVNGSLIGAGPYSIAIGAKFELPQQAFFLVDSKRGKTESCPIWVSERQVEG